MPDLVRSTAPLKFFIESLLGLVFAIGTASAWGQTDLTTNVVQNQQSVYRPYYGADTAFSAQLKAEAEFVRASGEAALNGSRARHETARSVELELHNWVNRLMAHQARRRLGEQERERHYVNPHDRQAAQEAVKIRRTFAVTGVEDIEIISGDVLNFLAQQIAVQANDLEGTQIPVRQLRLTPKVVRAIRLRERLPGGGGVPFTLIRGEPQLDINWPAPLRSMRLIEPRCRFIESYDRLVDTAIKARGQQPLVESCLSDLRLLRTAYERTLPAGKHLESVKDHTEHKQSVALLKSLEKQVERIGETSGRGIHLLPWDDTPGDLATVVEGMNRWGLEFAPCEAGDEAAYHELFAQLKILYRNRPPQHLELVQRP
jgi:hypothetical protein